MEKFTNPIQPRANDPYVLRDGEGYLYCYSLGNGVAVTRADKLHEIAPKEGAAVYVAPEDGEWSKEYWAPELHKISGRYYIYVAADDGNNERHRMLVLGAKSDDPTGEYELLGKISDPSDKWAIDGTILKHSGEHYFIWSGWEGDENIAQNLYIARMKSPTELDGGRVCLSTPEFEWEQRGSGNGLPTINEGPAILQRDGATYLVYSASGSWCDDYCLGMLALVGDDPMKIDSWVKSETPVFAKAEGAYGPGHCCFTTSPDGSEDYMVYHANVEAGTSWGGRSLRLQKVRWVDGAPIFGEPARVGEELPLPSDGYSLPHGRMQPSGFAQSVAAAIISLAGLVLLIVGCLIGREHIEWFVPLIGVALIVELVWLWQLNCDWLGKFILTSDGILCTSPLSVDIILPWEMIVDACYLPGNPSKPHSGTFCLLTEKRTLAEKQKLEKARVSEKLIKLADRDGLWEALSERLPDGIRTELADELALHQNDEP